MSVTVTDFELPNVGRGPDPYRLHERAGDPELDGIVLLFQRDYQCRNCRGQVQAVADRYDEFESRNAAAASVLPEPPAKASKWQAKYDLPFALLADGDKTVCEQYDQPTRYGALGRVHDVIGRMPQSVVLDVRGDPTVHSVHEGESPSDRPTVDDLLARIDEFRGD